MAASQFREAIENTHVSLSEWKRFTEIFYAIGGPEGSMYCPETVIRVAQASSTIRQLGTKLTDANELVGSLDSIELATVLPDHAILDLTTQASAVRSSVEALLARVKANADPREMNTPPDFEVLYSHVRNLLTGICQIRGIAGINSTDGFC